MRISLINPATRTWDECLQAMNAGDSDGAAACYAEPLDHDGHASHERIMAQYSHFQGCTLAVRAQRLHLGWMRCTDDSGSETCYLFVHEVDGTGRFVYERQFDEDDFETAYRELDRRYYADEGAALADQGRLLTDCNQRDLDPDLVSMVRSARCWHSALYWRSPHWVLARAEREAVGMDAERYRWSSLVVYNLRGRAVSVCTFEPDDEEAAVAYVEEQIPQE